MNIGQSQFILNKIPQHVLNEYPLFVDFIKAYYEYMDQSGKSSDIINNSIIYGDIDETMDSFIQYFKNDLMKDVPSQYASDERLLLKHIKELYTSKGSEASYKLLFRALYNKEIQFYSPINNILRPSDGKWHQDYSITVKIPVSYIIDDFNFFTNKELKVMYGNQPILVSVVDSKLLYTDSTYNIVEFYLLKNLNNIGKIQNLSSIVSTQNISVVLDGEFTGILAPTLSSVSALQGGSGMMVGMMFPIDESMGNNGKFLIKNTINGSILDVEIINFGNNYYTNFQQIINAQSSNLPTATAVLTDGVITSINLDSGGSGYIVAPTITIIGDGVEAKAHCTISGGIVDNIILDYGGKNYSTVPSVIFDQSSAVVNFTIGSVRRYPGFYTASDSLISDDSYLPDGYYYQTYSYVIEVDELFSTYKNILKKILHPSGYKLFGAVSNFDIKNLASVGVSIPAQVGNFPFDSLFMYDSIIWDFAMGTISDSITFLDEESHVLFDYFKILPVDTNVSLDDGYIIHFNKNGLSDSFSMNEISQIINYGKNISESIQFIGNDTTIYNFSKNLPNDAFSLNDTQMSKNVSKLAIPDSVDLSIDANSFNIGKTVADSLTSPDVASFEYSLVVSDGLNVIGMGENESYSTNFNLDYFSNDYLQEYIGIS